MRTSLAAVMMLAASTAAAMDGQKVAEVYQYCTETAYAECGKETIYCRNYRYSYVKMCLVRNNVPPDYIAALLQ